MQMLAYAILKSLPLTRDVFRAVAGVLLLMPIACSFVLHGLGWRMRTLVTKDPDWRIYARLPRRGLRWVLVDTTNTSCPEAIRTEYARTEAITWFVTLVFFADLFLIVLFGYALRQGRLPLV